MSDIAVEVNHVSKKFHRGELHDSLRDLIPALARRLVGRGPKRDELAKDDFWALDDVSFQVKRGEVLGIIGPNGAGKSTLLKILARILKPNRGSVKVNGRLRALIEIAAGFHPDLTGRENIYLNGTIMGMKRREIAKKFDQIVDFSGIEEFLDTPVKRYSSGMYARLGFAVAAHLDPEILIVDEVLAVGDAEFQKKCLGKMRDVAGEGRTVLFVSHNMQAVRRLCSRAICLENGRVVADQSTEAVISQYIGKGVLVHCSVAAYPHSATKKAQVLRLAVTDSTGNDLATPHELNTPFNIHITYIVHKRLSTPYIACAFKSVEGNVIFFLDSRDGGQPTLSFDRGEHHVRIRLQGALLNAGSYTLHVGIRDGAEQLEAVGGQIRIELHDLETKRPHVRPGYFAVKPLWITVEKPDSSAAMSGAEFHKPRETV